MKLISMDGLVIRQLKNWVLRCHACYKYKPFNCSTWCIELMLNNIFVSRVTTNMEKKFCPSCGNTTLLRTSVSTDANGNVRYHLKKDMQWRVRGTKVSNNLTCSSLPTFIHQLQLLICAYALVFHPGPQKWSWQRRNCLTWRSKGISAPCKLRKA